MMDKVAALLAGGEGPGTLRPRPRQRFEPRPDRGDRRLDIDPHAVEVERLRPGYAVPAGSVEPGVPQEAGVLVSTSIIAERRRRSAVAARIDTDPTTDIVDTEPRPAGVAPGGRRLDPPAAVPARTAEPAPRAPSSRDAEPGGPRPTAQPRSEQPAAAGGATAQLRPPLTEPTSAPDPAPTGDPHEKRLTRLRPARSPALPERRRPVDVAEPGEPEVTVHVSIGRIEVRMPAEVRQAQQNSAERRSRPGLLSLEDYGARRGGRR